MEFVNSISNGILGIFKILILLSFFVLISCNQEKKIESDNKSIDTLDSKILQLKPDVLSEWNDSNNIDSPAFYQYGDTNIVITTSKSSDMLFVYNAVDGSLIKTIGSSGNKLGQFKRPNGIWVHKDLCFIVERDNHRVQVLKLPEFTPLIQFASEKLIKPYGLTVFQKDSLIHVYITDNYEFEEDIIPADSLLGKRVLHYSLESNNSKISNIKFVKYIGETSGDGVLKVVESIYADPINNNLLICEELEGKGNTCIKVYDLDGNYKSTIGLDIFNSQAEGLALIECQNEGYWISTDQSKTSNIFHFFKRSNFEYVTSFESINLKNTDGIWLTQKSYKGYNSGAFIAVNDDGGIGIWNLETLLKQLKISCQ